uniref:REM-1 domain-containing protein n=1 Tax=Macrostomum lignano TaxID=282301 RepID=A0A1I8F5R3_9PLAT
MDQNVQLYQTQQAGNGKRLGGHSKMEMTDVASNYTAVSNPRQAMTRYLQAQNKKLKDELAGLKSPLGQGDRENPSDVRRGAEQQLRRLLDDAERMKGEKDAKLASL